MSHVRNNYGPQGVFKDHRRDRYGQLAIGIVTSRPRIVFPTWEVHRVSSETMNPWNSVRGFHGMLCARETLGLRGWIVGHFPNDPKSISAVSLPNFDREIEGFEELFQLRYSL